MKEILVSSGGAIAILAAAMAAALVWSAPVAPPALSHIGERFEGVDFSAMPAPQTYATRAGDRLNYRFYDRGAGRIVIALHGSSGSGVSLHPLAEALAGVDVALPDIRGHGGQGPEGDVAYIGQPEDDLEDLILHLRKSRPEAEIALAGFSMGGGLALRFAAGRPGLVDRLILMSPYLHHEAPPMKAKNPFAPATPWVGVATPRIMALSLLNGFGVHAFDHLPTIAFAVREEDAAVVTGEYSHRLLTSVNPKDWRSELKALSAPPAVLVGAEDELHHAPGYAVIADHAPGARIITVPGVDHIGLTLDPAAFDALAAVVEEDWS